MQRHLISILSIAASDCSGGAGIQADIKAAAMRNVYASTALTAVTVQNSKGLTEMGVISPELVIRQIESVLEDAIPGAIKIGMLGSLVIGHAVAEYLRDHLSGIPIVVDPVMSVSAGCTISTDLEAITEFYVNALCPLATIVTPNLVEACQMGSFGVSQEHVATELLSLLKCKAVIVKGGHDGGEIISDVLAMKESDLSIKIDKIVSSKINCKNLHGTGCVYSSILAAELAKGNSISDAFKIASTLMRSIIIESKGYQLGKSDYGPLNLFGYQTT